MSMRRWLSTTRSRAGLRRRIEHWEPEDPAFWARTGHRVATRNLICSILVEHLGFSIWLLWSVVVVYLPAAGFRFTADQLLWLVAVPNLVGALLRLPYTFAVPMVGGRNWTVISALALLLPAGLLAWCAADPATPYWMFVVAAATAGLGGGNFASSMANISFFYPASRKGLALGINAAGGNLGVAAVQAVIPVVISVGAGAHLVRAGLMWVPLVVAAAVVALLFMDNLRVAASGLAVPARALRRGHTWTISLLYLGTFGSFIGYSAALPMLAAIAFPRSSGGHFVFLGALVGSLIRPVGGWLADRWGGGRVTAASFMALGAGVPIVLVALREGDFGLFLGAFVLLFVAGGIGNGAVYRMIPAVFAARARQRAAGGVVSAGALLRAGQEAAAAIGIASAVGAFGGFFVPRVIAMSLTSTRSVAPALYAFLGFYVLCLIVTWWFYLRQRLLAGRAPSLAHAEV
ncbi:MFS transporter [Streptosporangium sp. CA-135522]|uniref:MFS transporter n=1 Tax=Streptosporangium sp. CA-135522 TaxID=3240072 RepID=UPI003D91871B